MRMSSRWSPLKSSVSTLHAGTFGAGANLALPAMVGTGVPRSKPLAAPYQTGLGSAPRRVPGPMLNHRMSVLPSLSKSLVDGVKMSESDASGALSGALWVKPPRPADPYHADEGLTPLGSNHRMSVLPSPLKSPVTTV